MSYKKYKELFPKGNEQSYEILQEAAPTMANALIDTCVECHQRECDDCSILAALKIAGLWEKEPSKTFEGQIAGQPYDRVINNINYRFRWCPSGTCCSMGNPEYPTTTTQYLVTLTKGFWLLETPVTRDMWQSIMQTKPNIGDIAPVENVSWYDCQNFCNRMRIHGINVQLPSEAQWEYASRASSVALGTDVRRWWTDHQKALSYSEIEDIAWYQGNCHGRTDDVGRRKPNAWGLHDMIGNVWEWCSDDLESYIMNIEQQPNRQFIDPQPNESRALGVCRGGCWESSTKYCQHYTRYKINKRERSIYIGFRILSYDPR